MADKYVDSTLTTGLNDGTSIANAWQSLEIVMRNTIASGSYAAGDIIHIRTHDGTSNITEVLSTGAITTAYDVTGSDTNPIVFLADAGIKWAGDSGIFTLEKTDDNVYCRFTGGAKFKGINQNFHFYASKATTYARAWQFGVASLDAIEFESVYFYTNNVVSISTINIQMSEVYVSFYSCKFKMSQKHTSQFPPLHVKKFGTTLILDNCEFDLAYFLTDNPRAIIAVQVDYGCTIVINGGKLVNEIATQAVIDVPASTASTSNSDYISITGLDKGTAKSYMGDGANALLDTTGISGNGRELLETYINGTTSFRNITSSGVMEWSENGNYPTLDSVLPDASSSGWSIKALPGVRATIVHGNPISNIHKYWNGVASTLNVTIEMLIKDTSGVGSGAFENLTKAQCYLQLMYTRNSNDEVIMERSIEDATALAASTAGWSSTTYGAQSYDKFKILLTTAHAVKPDTLVLAQVVFKTHAILETDFFFIDPDVKLEVT